MVSRRVNIIAIQERYLDIITKQVKKVLGDKIVINAVTVKDIQKNTIAADDIVVISNQQIRGLIDQFIPSACPVIVAKRDINYANTQKLVSLPPNQQILVVNDNKVNTDETVESLRQTIFEHNYKAYSPDEVTITAHDYIVTPGERHLLPRGLPNVIDIGARLLDIEVFKEIINLSKLNYPESHIIKRYFKACVSLSSEHNEKKDKSKDIRDMAQYSFADIIAVSKDMRESIHQAKKFSKKAEVKRIHIEGKPGTGKNMLAQAIHNYSDNAELAFVSFDCTSEDASTIEKVLFGCVNESEAIHGVLELAEKGTLCIEEIGELPLLVQEKLLQALKEGTFFSIGSNEPHLLRCRLITTNSESCEALTKKELFNKELYDLLTAYSIELPALSERTEDIFPLIENAKLRIKRSDIKFTKEVDKFFNQYSWSGNVKELYNTITYLSSLEEESIGIEHLPFHLRAVVNEKVTVSAEVNGEIISKIEGHGFLDESLEILNAFYEGKKNHISYGRNALKKCLETKGFRLSEQQLRMRLEVLQELGLTIVRQGRAGSTISRKGEKFLESFTEIELTI